MKSIIFHTMKTIGKSIGAPVLSANPGDFPSAPFGIVPINMHRSKREELLSKRMMIGKALLSGLWAPCGLTWPSSCLTLAQVSLIVSPFFWPLSLRRLCRASKWLHVSCYACWRHVVSGILAGGSLVSAWCFCCFAHLLVWPCDFLGSSLLFLLPYLVKRIQSITLALIRPWTGTCHISGWLFCCGLLEFVLVVCFLVVFSVCLFCLFLVLAVVSVCFGDVVTDWTVYRYYTRSPL